MVNERDVSARWRKVYEAVGLDDALRQPVSGGDADEASKMEDLLFGGDAETNRKDLQDAVALAGFTFGDLIYDAACIDPMVVQAADFSRNADLGTLLDFSIFADRIGNTSAAVARGAEANLSGYVAEQVVAARLVERGHQVEFPDTSNQAGFDLLIDGVPTQVKCVEGMGALHEHFDKYPNIPVIANDELMESIVSSSPEWADKVYFVDGYSHDVVERITDDSLNAGAELLDPEIPLFAAFVAGARGTYEVFSGRKSAADALADVVADVTAKGVLAVGGAVAGKVSGLLLFGPAGGYVFGGVVALVAATQSNRVLRLIKSAKTTEAEDDLAKAARKLLYTSCEAIDDKLAIITKKREMISKNDRISHYVRERFDDSAAYLRERRAEMQSMVKRVDLSSVDRALRAFECAKKSNIHPMRLQDAYKKVFEAFQALNDASSKWLVS